jgi:hypothetical protein
MKISCITHNTIFCLKTIGWQNSIFFFRPFFIWEPPNLVSNPHPIMNQGKCNIYSFVRKMLNECWHYKQRRIIWTNAQLDYQVIILRCIIQSLSFIPQRHKLEKKELCLTSVILRMTHWALAAELRELGNFYVIIWKP